jgi:hypothetical protein
MSKLEIGMSAGEARELGLHVSDHVPDCARLEPRDQTGVEVRALDNGGFDVEITISAAWQWLDFKFEISMKE